MIKANLSYRFVLGNDDKLNDIIFENKTETSPLIDLGPTWQQVLLESRWLSEQFLKLRESGAS